MNLRETNQNERLNNRVRKTKKKHVGPVIQAHAGIFDKQIGLPC